MGDRDGSFDGDPVEGSEVGNSGNSGSKMVGLDVGFAYGIIRNRKRLVA